jgi:hypothetical protein
LRLIIANRIDSLFSVVEVFFLLFLPIKTIISYRFVTY